MASFVIMVIRLHVIFMFFKCADCQVLSTCLLPIYNQECDLKCTTVDQSKIISFYKLPDATDPVAQCLGTNCQLTNTSLSAKYSIQSTDSTTTTFRINNLSWDEKGTWRCVYDSIPDTKVLGFAKYPDDIEYSGLSNNSEISSDTEMTITITMKCLYTDISTLVTLIYLRDGSTVRSTLVSCTDVTFSCANSNFVSKSCTAQLGSGVACGGNYSIGIAVSVLENEEETHSAFTGITIKCTGGGGSSSGALIAGIIVAVIVITVIIIIIICCLLNKRCRSRYLRKDSKFLFTWPRKDIVVFDIHDKDLKIERPTGEKIEIQCIKTKEGWYEFDSEWLSDDFGVIRVRNSPGIIFNPYIEIYCLKMNHEGLYKFQLKHSAKTNCSLTLEIRKDILISSKPLVYWAHEGEWLKLQPAQTSFVVRWIKKNSKTGKETRMPNQPKKNSLVLKNINNEDAGSYIAENTSEKWKSGSFTLNIVNSLVTVGKKDCSHVTIIKNSVKLKFTECMLSSIKRLKWKKSLLTDETEIRELDSTLNYELILSIVTLEDEGRYWCEVDNNDGTSTKSGILTLQVVHAIVDVGMKSASYKATIGDSIQIRCTKKIIPHHIIFSVKRSGTNQIAPKPKITQTAALLIEKISKGDEGCYQFEAADGKVKTGVTTLSVMKDTERYSSIYTGKSGNLTQPRRGANQTLDSITEKSPRKKKKKDKKRKRDNEETKIKENGDKTEIEYQPPDIKDS